MISNELLSEVLRLHCGIKSIKNSGVIYWFDCIGEIREHSINIYELTHKCKEWAYKEGFIIDTGFHKYHINQFKANCYGWVSSNINIKQHFSECTEHKATFKACQWVLDNKDNK